MAEANRTFGAMGTFCQDKPCHHHRRIDALPQHLAIYHLARNADRHQFINGKVRHEISFYGPLRRKYITAAC